MANLPNELLMMIFNMVIEDFIPNSTPFYWTWPENKEFKRQIQIFRGTCRMFRQLAQDAWFERVGLSCGENLNKAVPKLIRDGLEFTKVLRITVDFYEIDMFFDPELSPKMYQLFSALESWGTLVELNLSGDPREPDENYLFYQAINELLKRYRLPKLRSLRLRDIESARHIWEVEPNNTLRLNLKNLTRLSVTGLCVHAAQHAEFSSKAIQSLQAWVRTLKNLNDLELDDVSNENQDDPIDVDDERLQIQTMIHSPSLLTRLSLNLVYIKDAFSQFIRSTRESHPGARLRVIELGGVALNPNMDRWKKVFKEVRKLPHLESFEVDDSLRYYNTSHELCDDVVLCSVYEEDKVALGRLVDHLVKNKLRVPGEWYGYELSCDQ